MFIIELHATQLFQLLFHTTAHFQCKDKDLLQLLFGKLTVRVQQLYIAAYDLTHCDRITLIQIFTKAEILISYPQSLNILLPGAIIKENGKEVHLCSTPDCTNRSSTTH